MRSATGEPEPAIDLTQLEEIEKRFDKFQISASPDITIAGSIHQGYALNIPTCEAQEAESPPPVDCCNREVTEISTMTLSANVSADCGVDCTGGCSISRTWHRIPHTVAHTPGMDEFWLWTEDPGCNMLVEFFQDDFLHPTATCVDTGAGLAGSVDLNQFQIFPSGGHNFDILMQFFVALSRISGTCLDGDCNGFSDPFDIPVTACDVSALRGNRVFSKTCTTGMCTLTIEGHVVFA